MRVPKAQAESCTHPPQLLLRSQKPKSPAGQQNVGGSAQGTGCLSAQLCPHRLWALPDKPAHAPPGPWTKEPWKKESMGREPLPSECFPRGGGGGACISPFPPPSLSWLLFTLLALSPLPLPCFSFLFPLSPTQLPLTPDDTSQPASRGRPQGHRGLFVLN